MEYATLMKLKIFPFVLEFLSIIFVFLKGLTLSSFIEFGSLSSLIINKISRSGQ